MSRDVLYSALKSGNVGYLSRIADVMGKDVDKGAREGLLNDRLDPLIYFKKLTQDPKELLLAMDKYKVVLSGSRAAGYFCPQLCTPQSDWDFYTAASGMDVVAFIKVLNKAGIAINSMRGELDVDEDSLDYRDVSCVIKMSHASTGHSVQLMVCCGPTVLSAITGFDISAVQCIITGRFAMSLYHCLTKDMKAFFWSDERIESYSQTSGGRAIGEVDQRYAEKATALKDRRLKYLSRGLAAVEYSEYHSLIPEVPFSKLSTGKLRSMGDEGCGTVKFEKFGLPAIDNERILSKCMWRDLRVGCALLKVCPDPSKRKPSASGEELDVDVDTMKTGESKHRLERGIVTRMGQLCWRINESEVPI